MGVAMDLLTLSDELHDLARRYQDVPGCGIAAATVRKLADLLHAEAAAAREQAQK
jgi:hypothetical protein